MGAKIPQICIIYIHLGQDSQLGNATWLSISIIYNYDRKRSLWLIQHPEIVFSKNLNIFNYYVKMLLFIYINKLFESVFLLSLYKMHKKFIKSDFWLKMYEPFQLGKREKRLVFMQQ